jgi:hypothetical protein
MAQSAYTMACFTYRNPRWASRLSTGTTKLHRLAENIGAAAVELMPEDLRDLAGAASKITVQGERYPEELEKRTGR